MKKVLLSIFSLLALGWITSCQGPTENAPPAALPQAEVKVTVTGPTSTQSSLSQVEVRFTSASAAGAMKALTTYGETLFSGLKPGSYTLEAKAYQKDGLVLGVTSIPVTLQTGMNSVSLVITQTKTLPVDSDSPAGTYAPGKAITLTCGNPTAVINYTLDGSNPSASSPVYSSPIVLNQTKDYILKAMASVAGKEPSSVGTWLYTIANGVLNPPSAAPASGTISDEDTISFTVASGYEVYYTVDGSNPNPGSVNTKKYAGPFKLSTLTLQTTVILKALTQEIATENKSAVATFSYVVNSSTPAAPEISPADGSYETSATVTMIQAAGREIRYTLDGSTPTAASTPYSGSFSLNQTGVTTTIKAIAVYNGKTSGVTTRTITIVAPQTLSAPGISPADGTFQTSVSVSMNQAQNAEIRYTTDGSTPTATSNLYSGSFNLTTVGTVVVKALARTSTQTSNVTTRTYVITKAPSQATTVTLSADKTSVAPSATVTFTAAVLDQYGDAMAGQTITLYQGTTAQTGMTFTTAVEGTYKFTAKSGTLTSSEVSVLVKKDTPNARYSTNPNGQVGKYKTGMTVTCVNTKSDGFTEWTPDMIIAQGAANDDAKSFYGGHEYPCYDTYALYAAWDDTNLYLGWQIVYVNDVTNPSNNGGNEAKPTNANMPQMIVFDIEGTKASIGTQASGKNIWYDSDPAGFNFDKSLGIDKIAMFSSKGGVGTPSLFSMNPDGFFDYKNLVNFTTAGIVYGAVDGFNGTTMWGVKKYPYVPADLDLTTDWVEMVAQGHKTSLDTFYEMKIPLAALGITRATLESQGIGVMHISIYGTSGVDSIPKDRTATLDNATKPYSKDPSTSMEKEDLDLYTVPLARIGKLK